MLTFQFYSESLTLNFYLTELPSWKVQFISFNDLLTVCPPHTLEGRRSQRASADGCLTHTRTLYYVLHWVAERGTEGVLRRVELRLA